jgi:hypothetical protein
MSSLPFKPNLDEKLDLNSASFRSTKTGRFTRKFPLEKFIASLNKLTDTSEKIKLVSSELVDSSQLVVADLDKFLLSKKKTGKTILVMVIHHIAFDGWSADIFLNELILRTKNI